MSEFGATSRARRRWDEHAATEESLTAVVGVGQQGLEQSTYRFLDRQVETFLTESIGSERCLDAGCGVGLAFPLLQRVFDKVIGLDFSCSVLARIPTSVRSEPHLAFCGASVTAVPLQDESVDAVHCRDTFQFLPADQVLLALQEFYRVLKPGGVTVVHFKNCEHLMSRVAAVRRSLLWGGRPTARSNSNGPEPTAIERCITGDWDARPWSWYLRQCEAAGFVVERQFSWQLFFWGRLRRYKMARFAERLERKVRQRPLLERLVRHDGINYYLLLRRPVGDDGAARAAGSGILRGAAP